MSYATIDDMMTRFERGDGELSRLTDKTNMPPVDVDWAAVQAALNDASDECNSYLAQVYQLPLLGCLVPGSSPPAYTMPTLLVKVCCDVARYNLYDEKPTEQIAQRYKDAVLWLKQLVAGKAQLTCPSPPISIGGLAGVPLANNAQVAGGGVSYSFAERVFDTASLSSFRLGDYGQRRGGRREG